MYVFVALPPGTNKSLVLKMVTAPLVYWEKGKIKEMAPEIKKQRLQLKLQEKEISYLSTQMVKQEDEEKKAEMLEVIQEKHEVLIEVGTFPKLFATDATPEALADAACEQDGRYAIISDEGGIIEVLSGLYSSGKANTDLFLKGIDGGYVRIKRKDTEVCINPYLNFLLIVQPKILADMAERPSFTGKGVLERFLYVVPKVNLGYRTHDTDEFPDEVRDQYQELLLGLLKTANLYWEDIPETIKLDGGALGIWRAFQKETEVELRSGNKLHSCPGWGAKICGFTLRIAGLIHAVDLGINHTTISYETMDKAIRLAKLLKEHALAAYGAMNTDKETAAAKEILKWIASNEMVSFTRTELLNAMKNRTFGKAETLKKVLKVLIDRNIIGDARAHVSEKAKKPTTYYDVNPKVKECYNEQNL